MRCTRRETLETRATARRGSPGSPPSGSLRCCRSAYVCPVLHNVRRVHPLAFYEDEKSRGWWGET